MMLRFDAFAQGATFLTRFCTPTAFSALTYTSINIRRSPAVAKSSSAEHSLAVTAAWNWNFGMRCVGWFTAWTTTFGLRTSPTCGR
jgi:hypothetical protein